MPSPQGPLNCGTGADDAGVGTITWTNPTNIASGDDDTYAEAVINTGEISHYLKGTNFGHTIPAATILGREFTYSRTCNGGIGTEIRDYRVRVIKNGTISTTELGAGDVWSSGFPDEEKVFGGPTDLCGETWTSGDINSSTSGIAIAVTNNEASGDTAKVDRVTSTVYYTEISEYPFRVRKQSRTVDLKDMDPDPSGPVKTPHRRNLTLLDALPLSDRIAKRPGVPFLDNENPPDEVFFRLKKKRIPISVYIGAVLGDYAYYQTLTGEGNGIGGSYRVANDIAGYVIYIGEDGPPIFNGSPQGYSATLPVTVAITPPVSGTTAFHVVVRKRNPHGIESPNQYATIIVVDSTGAQVLHPLLTPQDVLAIPQPNGKIRILAKYPTLGIDPHPPNEWRFWISAGTIDPLVDLPTATSTPMTNTVLKSIGTFTAGTYNVVVGVFRDQDSALTYAETTVVVPESPDIPPRIYSGFNFPAD